MPADPLPSRLAVPDLLQQRVRTNGAVPLITYDDRVRAERTELSATSFANWVDKTANLLVDELDVEPADVVSSRLAQTHPGHWMSLVWTVAVWQVGATLALPGTADHDARVLVVGPDDVHAGTDDFGADVQVVACSLHPLGLGFSTDLPTGVLDYAADVRIQPDAFLGDPTPADSWAWLAPDLRLRAHELVSTAAPSKTARGGRRLVVPHDPWRTLADAVLVPLATDGSAVIAVGADEDVLQSIATAERVTERAG